MLILVAELGVLLVLVSSVLGSKEIAIFVSVVITCGLAPVGLTAKSQVIHVGIAGGGPELYTYTAVVIAGTLALTFSRTWVVPPSSLVVVLVFCAIEAVFNWGTSSNLQAGVLHLATVVLAFALGQRVGREFLATPNAALWVCASVLLVLNMQLVLSILQLAGHPLNFGGRQLNTGLYGSRATGSLISPGNLSKVALILVTMVIPYTRHPSRSVRSLAKCGIISGVVLTGLTQSRANAVAIILTLILWSFLSPNSRGIGAKIRMILLSCVLAAPFAVEVAQRFKQDPDGGARPSLLAAGIKEIGIHPFSGIGVNNYVEVVGQWDPSTALGFPVHNTFVLASAEMGIPAALLLFLPYARALLTVWARRRTPDEGGRFAASLLASAPGIFLICYTGWGMLSTFVAVLWFFSIGFTTGAMVRSTPIPPRTQTCHTSPPAIHGLGGSR